MTLSCEPFAAAKARSCRRIHPGHWTFPSTAQHQAWLRPSWFGVEEPTDGSGRARQVVELSVHGRKSVRSGWRRYLEDGFNADVEAILRIVDMAGHYGATSAELSAFSRPWLRRVRKLNAYGARDPPRMTTLTRRSVLQQLWASARTRAEASFLSGIATAQPKKQETANTTPRSAAKTKRAES